jgi:hypothetical protein
MLAMTRTFALALSICAACSAAPMLDLGAPINCEIVSGWTGTRVYQGSSTDPYCRGYHPELGVDGNIEIPTDPLFGFWETGDTDPNAPPFVGGLNYLWYGFLPARREVGVDETRLYLNFTLPAISIRTEIRATFPGSGYLQFFPARNDPFSWGGSPTLLEAQWQYPVFQRGREQTVAVMVIDSGGPITFKGSVSDAFLAIRAEEQGFRAYSVSGPETVQSPEPSTVGLSLIGIAAIWFRRAARALASR